MTTCRFCELPFFGNPERVCRCRDEGYRERWIVGVDPAGGEDETAYYLHAPQPKEFGMPVRIRSNGAVFDYSPIETVLPYLFDEPMPRPKRPSLLSRLLSFHRTLFRGSRRPHAP